MASTPRTLMLLGFLVASFYVAANAGHHLAETSKLDPGLVNVPVEDLLAKLLGSNEAIIKLRLTIDLTKVTTEVLMTVQNGLGGAVPLDVSVKADGLLTITLTINGEEKTFEVPLVAVTTAVYSLAGMIDVVLALVDTVANGLPVITVTNTANRVIAVIEP